MLFGYMDPSGYIILVSPRPLMIGKGLLRQARTAAFFVPAALHSGKLPCSSGTLAATISSPAAPLPLSLRPHFPMPPWTHQSLAQDPAILENLGEVPWEESLVSGF